MLFQLTNTDRDQFFLRTADADVERYLKLFTFIPLADIQTLMQENAQDPSKRIAQHRLALEVLSLVHSDEDAATAASQHASLFGRKASPPVSSYSPPLNPSPNPHLTTVPTNAPPDVSSSLNKHAPITTAFNSPSMHITLPRSLVTDQPIARVLYSAGLVASRSEGHRLCAQQGAYVGSKPSAVGPMSDALEFSACKNWKPEDTNQFIIDEKLLILRVGKWKVKIVKIVDDEAFEAQGLTCPGWKEEISKEEKEMLDRQARDTSRQGPGDTRVKRFDRAFSRFLEDRKAERGGPSVTRKGKEIEGDIKEVMGHKVSKSEKERMAYKHGIEI